MNCCPGSMDYRKWRRQIEQGKSWGLPPAPKTQPARPCPHAAFMPGPPPAPTPSCGAEAAVSAPAGEVPPALSPTNDMSTDQNGAMAASRAAPITTEGSGYLLHHPVQLSSYLPGHSLFFPLPLPQAEHSTPLGFILGPSLHSTTFLGPHFLVESCTHLLELPTTPAAARPP